MDKSHYVAALEQIIALAQSALKTTGDAGTNKKSAARARVVKSRTPRTALDYIIALRNDGFLKQPQTAEEVHKKLQSDYPCELNRVAVALLRLKKKGELRKVSKVVAEKKRVAYVG